MKYETGCMQCMQCALIQGTWIWASMASSDKLEDGAVMSKPSSKVPRVKR